MERKGIFKGYSEDVFWPILIGHTIDSMNYALLTSGGDNKRKQEILQGMCHILYTLYETTFNDEHKFIEYMNETILAVLDTKYPINDDGTINNNSILETLKHNWKKYLKEIYENTK